MRNTIHQFLDTRTDQKPSYIGGVPKREGWLHYPLASITASSRLSVRICMASTKPRMATPPPRRPISSAFTGAVSGLGFTVDNAMLGEAMNEDLSKVARVLLPDD